jgi:hypothetical protein
VSIPDFARRRSVSISAVAKGYVVVPVEITIDVTGKHPSFPLGKRDGDRGVLRTVEEVRKHWNVRPGDHPAIVTGELVLVDLDTPAAIEAWEALCHDEASAGFEMESLRGNQHRYFRARVGQRVKNTTGALAPGIDTCGHGRLAFITAHLPRLHELPEAPAWLPTAPPDDERSEASETVSRETAPGPMKDEANESRTAGWLDAALNAEVQSVMDAPTGQRNNALNKAAYNLAGYKTTAGPGWPARVWNALVAAGEASGLDRREIKKTLRSGWESGQAKPRAVNLDAETEEASRAMTDRDGAVHDKPRLDIRDQAKAVARLKDEIGTGVLTGMYLRAGKLVHVPLIGQRGYIEPAEGSEDDLGPAQVRGMDAALLAARIDHRYDVGSNTEEKAARAGGEEVRIKRWNRRLLPEPMAKRLLSSAGDSTPGLPTLRGVVHTPVMRADGSILDVPGFDPDTGLAYLPAPGVRLEAGLSGGGDGNGSGSSGALGPTGPSAADVKDALELLREMVAGFPWLDDHHEANYLGLFLTPALRGLFGPPYQAGIIDAPMRGAGKTLAACVIRAVWGGVFKGEMPADEPEIAKLITSLLVDTTGAVIHVDNVTGRLKSSKLAALLTATEWSDRPLGSTRVVTAINDRLWCFTGNNVSIGGDLPRRCITARMDPRMPNPHLRTGFAINDLERWAAARRGDLVRAALVIARGWVLDGSPGVKEVWRSDSYATWCAGLRGMLAWAGHPGRFGHDTTTVEPDGDDDAEWATFLLALEREYGSHGGERRAVAFSPTEALGRISNDLLDVAGGVRVDEVPHDLAEKLGRLGAGKSLGRWLSNRVGRWAGDISVERAGRDRERGTLYELRRYVTEGGDSRDVREVS